MLVNANINPLVSDAHYEHRGKTRLYTKRNYYGTSDDKLADFIFRIPGTNGLSQNANARINILTYRASAVTFFKLLDLLVCERRPVALQLPLEPQPQLRVLVGARVVLRVSVARRLVDPFASILVERRSVGKIYGGKSNFSSRGSDIFWPVM